MPLQLVTPPTAEPLSLSEARAHLRVPSGDTSQDALITGLIAAARAYAELKCQRQILAARWKLVLDSFPGQGCAAYVPWGRVYGLPPNAILVPRGAVLQIASVQYTDLAGVLQTLTLGTDYVTDLAGDPARLTPPFGQVWPANVVPQIGAVGVTFDAGDAAKLTADATADTISVPGWKTLVVGDAVRLSNRDGALPAPLQPMTDYFVQSVPGAGLYKLAATSGGAAINLTDTGTGESFIGVIPEGVKSWMKLAIGTLYENRESVTVDTRITASELPIEFLDGLLDPFRLVLY
jgi:uncharacterized phiE125 gp8 family phage protein